MKRTAFPLITALLAAGRRGVTERMILDPYKSTSLWSSANQAVASELIRAGYPAQNVVIASNPEAFGNMSFGGNDASEKDRRVTILFSR